MSWPAQNAGPFAAMTTTRTDGSLVMALNSCCKASIVSRDKALRALGRFRVRVQTPASSWRSRPVSWSAAIGFVVIYVTASILV